MIIGKKIEFKSRTTLGKVTGIILDKISEQHSSVSPAWTRGGSSNDVTLIDTRTYYIVEEYGTGSIHRLSPEKILRIVNQTA